MERRKEEANNSLGGQSVVLSLPTNGSAMIREYVTRKKGKEFKMLRKLFFSVVVVLMFSSGALAAIGHAQDFIIDALNVVRGAGCVGSAEGSNIVMVGHAQEAYDTATGTAAFQEETAILTQSGSAAGMGGKAAVVQEAHAEGGQNQRVGIGCCSLGKRAEGQTLGVSLDMLTTNAKGIGGAVGAQGFVGAQSQIEITPNGMSASSQYIGAAQFSAVSGGHSKVNNSLDVVLNQSQKVMEGK